MCRGFTFEEAQAAAVEQLDMTPKKSATPFKKGDHVEIFRIAQKEWVAGEIVDIVQLGGHFSQVQAGSIKVSYDFGARCKWVVLQEADKILRASSRPQPPASFKGVASIEVAGWVFNSWRPMMMEMKDGLLLWYEVTEEGKRGKLAGSLHLQDFALERGAEDVVRLRTDLATYSFKFACLEEAWEWIQALELHAKHCEEVTQYLERLTNANRQGFVGIAKELYGGA